MAKKNFKELFDLKESKWGGGNGGGGGSGGGCLGVELPGGGVPALGLEGEDGGSGGVAGQVGPPVRASVGGGAGDDPPGVPRLAHGEVVPVPVYQDSGVVEATPAAEREVPEPSRHLRLRACQVAVCEADASTVSSIHGDSLLPLLGTVEGDMRVAGATSDDVLDVLGDHDSEVVIGGVGATVLTEAGADGAMVGWDGRIVEGRAEGG